jgi:predicted RNA binding protein YcfA (HicA-like mRNA interferase family)
VGSRFLSAECALESGAFCPSHPSAALSGIIEDSRRRVGAVVQPFPRRREDLPRKVRELVKDLMDVGFAMVPGGGKGSHRKFTHPNYSGAVTLSGRDGDDAKRYQERQVQRAIEDVGR